MVKVSLHAAAETEYEAALAWYLARSARAAERFEAAAERAVAFIELFPEASPLCDDRYRRCALRRYPYGLIYRLDGDKAQVVAVAHDRQLPGYWSGRA